MVQGLLDGEQTQTRTGNIEIINYLTSRELEKAINASEFVISRSGYTTIMDLACMGKKAYFIPTPGQTEQEYLALRLKNKGIVPYSNQADFKIKDLAKLSVYKGFDATSKTEDLSLFFGLFERKRKLRTHSIFALNIDFLFMRLYNMFHNRKTQP